MRTCRACGDSIAEGSEQEFDHLCEACWTELQEDSDDDPEKVADSPRRGTVLTETQPLRSFAIWKSGAELLFGKPGDFNRVYRANMSGGLIGWLASSGKRALSDTIRKANDDGYEAVFIVGDTTNFLKNLLYFIILCLTFFLWCPEPAYLILTKRRGPDSDTSRQNTARNPMVGST